MLVVYVELCKTVPCAILHHAARFQSDLSEITEENEEFEFQLKSVSPVELPDTVRFQLNYQYSI